jgi:hypothetical protein
MYKTATMLEYATIDEAWRSPLPVRRTYPRDTMKYTEPIAQISNDMPQQMTSSQPGAEYHRLEHRPDDLKTRHRFDRNEPSRASNEERERRDDTSSDSARREPDASVAEMDVRYNDNRVEEDTTLYDVCCSESQV